MMIAPECSNASSKPLSFTIGSFEYRVHKSKLSYICVCVCVLPYLSVFARGQTKVVNCNIFVTHILWFNFVRTADTKRIDKHKNAATPRSGMEFFRYYLQMEYVVAQQWPIE